MKIKETNTKTIILTKKELKQAITFHIRDIHSDKLAHYINTNHCSFRFTDDKENIEIEILIDREI